MPTLSTEPPESSGAQPLSRTRVVLRIAGGTVLYALLAVACHTLPNPMLPTASLALNMVVVVVAGYLWGPAAGAAVGLAGTLLSVVAEFPFFGLNWWAVLAVPGHTAMGAVAGWLGRWRSSTLAGLAVIVGHVVNLAVYVVSALETTAHVVSTPVVNGFLAETALDLILTVLTVHVIERVGERRRLPAPGPGESRLALWTRIGLAGLVVGASAAYLGHVRLVVPLFFVPVALAALLLGPLEAWLVSLPLSALLALEIGRRGLVTGEGEVATILSLNLVALVIGELAGRAQAARRLAQARARILEAVTSAASDILERDDRGREDVVSFEKLRRVTGAAVVALARLEPANADADCLRFDPRWISFAAGCRVEGLASGVSMNGVELIRFLTHGSRARTISGAVESAPGPIKEWLVEAGCTGFVALPVLSGGVPWGMLLLLVREGEPRWTREELAAMRTAVGMFVTALERTEAERTARQREERFALAARGANDGLWDWDIAEGSVFYSPRWKQMLGYGESEISPHIESWLSLVHPDERPDVLSALERHLQGKIGSFQQEYRIRHRDGGYRWMLCRGLATRNPDGAATRMAGSQTDVTERRNAEDQLLHNAFYDGLTGLPNRALFRDRLQIAVERSARREGACFAVILIDLDHFKTVNESLGHQAGDELLKVVGERLAGGIRPGETVSRLGGDEFAVLLEDLPDRAAALTAADRLIGLLAPQLEVAGHELFVRASAGVVGSWRPRATAEDFLRDADVALFQAKSGGRGRLALFDPEVRRGMVQRLQLETDLRRALDEGQIEVFYQPLVELAGFRIRGFEALARWRHPQRGLLCPRDFIPLSEELGLVAGIGRIALVTACSQLLEWRRQECPDLVVSVNLHSHQLRQADIVSLVTETLDRVGLIPEALRLEVTEQAMMEDEAVAARFMRQLSDLGVSLYLDDFGTGYSSLSYLLRFPVSTLKIDQSFVCSMHREESSRLLVEAVVLMAHHLGLHVVAEGVETMEQLELLRTIGCESAQGFLFSEPLPAAAATALLHNAESVPTLLPQGASSPPEV